jgi:hypothetical protein
VVGGLLAVASAGISGDAATQATTYGFNAGIEGQKLTWDLQVNSTAVSVKLVWIKAGKPVDKTGIATSQAQNKKRLSPSTRKRNALFHGV